MNAEHRRPRPETGLDPGGAGAQRRAWRDAVDRILAGWLLSRIDRAELWETVMANAPLAAGVTAVRRVDRPMAPAGPADTAGAPGEAAQGQGVPLAGARAKVGERSNAPRE